MFGMGFSEFVILIILLGHQGNVGVPLGVPPAEEVQLMSDVAPENCLFYASWATAGKLDGETNPTARWFAQPKIQDGWKRIQGVFLQRKLDSEQAYENALTQLLQTLAAQALVRSTAIFAETAPDVKSLVGGCVIHLEPEIATQVAVMVDALPGLLPAEWRARQFQIEGSSYLAFTPEESEYEFSVGLRGQFAIIGFGQDAIAKIEKNVRTPEPTWLSDLKKRLPVQRRSSISHFDVRGLLKLVEGEPWWTDFAEEPLKNILRLDSIIAFDSVCGLDDRGFVSRHRLAIDGETPVGLMSLLDAQPLTDADLKALSGERDWATGVRLSIANGWSLAEQLAALSGGSMDDVARDFSSTYGLRLREDVLDHLDGSILIHGNLDSGNPTGGWLVQIGVSDEMSFFDNLQSFNEHLEKQIQQEGGNVKFESNEIEGTEVFSLHVEQDFGIIPEPMWFLHNGRLTIGLDEETVRKWLQAPEAALSDDPLFQQLLTEARQSGLEQPIGVSRVDMASVIELMMSFSSMLAMGNAPIDVTDLPPTEVLINGLEPSVALTFRTKDGFEILARQTIPSAAPGATLAAAGIFAAPKVFAAQLSAKETMSQNNLRQIVIALHNYHDAMAALPARFNKGKDGEPLLSWRVHILPYLDHEELYRQFHLDEPWDSAHNQKLIEQMPGVLAHPKLELPAGHTAYLAIGGKDTIWQDPADADKLPKGLTLQNLSLADGNSLTAALVEVSAESAVIWTKPDDLDGDLDGFSKQLHGVWRNGLIMALADGSVQKFQANLSEEQLRNFFRINDGQPTAETIHSLRIER